MRIALFSDVHANLPALKSFFLDIEKREIDALYCLGDLVGYNIWPNEIIEEIRKRSIATIAGNHDEAIGNMIHNHKKIDVNGFFETVGIFKRSRPNLLCQIRSTVTWSEV